MIGRTGVLALLAVLVVAGLTPPALAHAPLPAGIGAGRGTPSLAPVSAASGADRPSSTQCPTPQNLPAWTDANFFDDVLVTFTVPGYPSISGANFATEPCLNTLPTYLAGFWMNLSTNVPITQAYVNVWGTTYPTPTDPLPPLTGFPVAAPVTVMPMRIAPGFPDQASFYFNTYRFFYPGTTVYFNVTVDSSNSTPSSVNSAGTVYRSTDPLNSSDNATWKFELAPPWWSPHFSDDVRLFTNPPVLGGQVLAPNANQSWTVALESVGATGAPAAPIGAGELTVTLSGKFSGTYGIPFGPSNSTFMNLTSALGPYPGTEVRFNVTVWMVWGPTGGAIDTLASRDYFFNWSSQGGWPSPSLGLAENAVINATPSSVLGATPSNLPTATGVNVSLHETLPNVTISSSVVRFHYSDAGGTLSGTLPMSMVSQNSSYDELPGLPVGGALSFSLLAKDVFENPLASGTYSYTESGPTTFSVAPLHSFFFVEAINASTGELLPGVHYTVSNGSWSQSQTTGPLGFGAPTIPGTSGYLGLNYGTYRVTVSALGTSENTTIQLNTANPLTVRFYFANGPVVGTATSPLPTLTVGLVAGLAAASVAIVPMWRWYLERQKKIAEEQRRITL